MIRILITGSRAWMDRRAIADHLFKVVTDLGGEIPYTPVTLVSGAAVRGADRIAEEIAGSWGWKVERHLADWNGPCRSACRPGHRRTGLQGEYCPAAGNYRNADMVNLGADACVAWIKNQSRGATNCADLAEKAGIPTTRIEV